jgi:hypothetical protein
LICSVNIGSKDDLTGRGDGLGVVALHRCPAASNDESRVRVGRVDLARGQRRRIRRERLAATELAAMRGLPLGPPTQMSS